MSAPDQPRPLRRPVAIAVDPTPGMDGTPYVLCDDGTVYLLKKSTHQTTGKWVELPPIPMEWAVDTERDVTYE